MRIHWLQHVPFEGLGTIADWASRSGHELHRTRLWAGDVLPDSVEVSFLIVMGGSMGVHDEAQFQWLAKEKRFIKEVVDHGGAVLGICLGAQLLADQLGGRVYSNQAKEIGWYPVTPRSVLPEPFAGAFPGPVNVFHWHGDTFDIPTGATHLLCSPGCENQAFIVNSRNIGLQFHLEMSGDGLAALIENCRGELEVNRWVQGEAEMLDCGTDMQACQTIMDSILDYLVSQQEPK